MKYFVWSFLWAIVVLLLTCLPMENAVNKVPAFEGMDKLVHTGFFFVFSVLLCFGYARKQESHKPNLITVICVFIFSSCLGLLTEFLQYSLFTYRSADKWDLFADTVGTCMGLFAYLILHRTNYRPTV